MLQSLHIENIAVIERADIQFTEGLCVLTGETGAGKSIVIDAIQAVLGGRVSRELVRSGTQRALVSAVFDAKGTESWCEENAIDPEDDTLLLLRRIGADGKSSCRVCGVAVTAAQLRELGSLLLDLQGQNDGRQLLDEKQHRRYLDQFAVIDRELRAFSAEYKAWQDCVKEIQRWNMDELEKQQLIDSLHFRIQELESAQLQAGEESELSARRDLLHNAEKLTELLSGAYAALSGDGENAVSLCETARDLTERAAAWYPELSESGSRLREACFTMEDTEERIRDLMDSLDFSPEEYDRLESRLAALRRLEKKYRTDEEGLIRLLDESRTRLQSLEDVEGKLEYLEKERDKREKKALAAGQKLSRAREAASATLSKRITEELTALNMPSASFSVKLTPVQNKVGFDAKGCETVQFLLSANKGEKPGPINRIASGGELSRIMLAMKNVFALRDTVPTQVFDEVDTGVSGVAAQRVAEKLASLSAVKQVLCVTHLPQIAAMADSHYSVEKAESKGRTYTAVTRLDQDGRRRELARLLGGENSTQTTLLNAAEQLQASAAFKERLKDD